MHICKPSSLVNKINIIKTTVVTKNTKIYGYSKLLKYNNEQILTYAISYDLIKPNNIFKTKLGFLSIKYNFNTSTISINKLYKKLYIIFLNYSFNNKVREYPESNNLLGIIYNKDNTYKRKYTKFCKLGLI